MSATLWYLLLLLSWAALNLMWQGFIILASLSLSSFWLRESKASIRHLLCCAHGAAFVLLPVFTICLAHRSVESTPVAQLGRMRLASQSLLGVADLMLRTVHLVKPWLPFVVTIWLTGVCVGILLIIRTHVHLYRGNRDFNESTPVLSVVRDIGKQVGIRSMPVIAVSDSVVSPYVVGVFRQKLVLPEAMAGELTEQELRAIIAHELAHVKRHDYVVNMLHAILAVVLWPLPYVWLLWAKLQKEQEVACDEIAIDCVSAPAMAHALFCLVAQGHRYIIAPGAAGSLEFRIRHLLNPRRECAQVYRFASCAAATLVLTAATMLFSGVLGSDPESRVALVASGFGPTITVEAHDPAGPFMLRLYRGRVQDISIANRRVPSEQVLQRGNVVRVFDRSGAEMLAIVVDARGGISWQPRERNSGN